MLHKNLFQDPILSVEIISSYGYFSGVVPALKVLLYIMKKMLVPAIFKDNTTILIKEMRFV